MMLKFAPLLSVLIVFSPATQVSAEGTGELTLNMAGTEYIVPLWSEQSDWSGGESWPSINIYARALSENGGDPLVVTLSFEASRWDPAVPELEVMRYEGGELAERLFAGEEQARGALSVNLDGHEFDGSTLNLTGSFEGTLGPSENRGWDIDLSEGVPVAGNFAVTLEALE